MKKRTTISIYHFTSKESAEQIMQRGFSAGAEGKVWFAESLCAAWGAVANGVLLSIRAKPSAIDKYLVVGKEEDWNSKEGKWIRSEDTENIRCYALPREIANRFPRRVLSEIERKRLW